MPRRRAPLASASPEAALRDNLFFCDGEGEAHLPLLTAGVDEAGRGPLAGPVCAAAVILDPENPIEGLADSKKLSAKKREALAPIIRERALAWGIGWATVEEIDRVNILNATYLAMERAVAALKSRSGSVTPEYILIDGNRRPPHLPCMSESSCARLLRIACRLHSYQPAGGFNVLRRSDKNVELFSVRR